MNGYTAGVMQDRWSPLEICSTSEGFRPCPELLDQVEGSSVALSVPPMSCVVHTGRAPTGRCRIRSRDTIDRGVSMEDGKIVSEYLVVINRASRTMPWISESRLVT
jgi:hypothetical protein